MSGIVSGLKRLSYGVAGLIGVLALFVFATRFADGPYGLAAGGEFTSGESHVGPEPDWSFVKDRGEVEFQLLDPARSRTTWILEHENRIYIPCGYMSSTWGRVWKQWPVEAQQDGRAVLRIDGVLYDRELIRIRDGDQLPFLLAELGRKYLQGDEPLPQEQQEQALTAGLEQIANGSLWIFEMVPRT